jgi:hypothetical protein
MTADDLATPGPILVTPPGVNSSQTPERVAIKMLARITANEKALGRALAPARILRIQLLREGEIFWVRHFDGTNPSDRGGDESGSIGGACRQVLNG